MSLCSRKDDQATTPPKNQPFLKAQPEDVCKAVSETYQSQAVPGDTRHAPFTWHELTSGAKHETQMVISLKGKLTHSGPTQVSIIYATSIKSWMTISWHSVSWIPRPPIIFNILSFDFSPADSFHLSMVSSFSCLLLSRVFSSHFLLHPFLYFHLLPALHPNTPQCFLFLFLFKLFLFLLFFCSFLPRICSLGTGYSLSCSSFSSPSSILLSFILFLYSLFQPLQYFFQ